MNKPTYSLTIHGMDKEQLSVLTDTIQNATAVVTEDTPLLAGESVTVTNTVGNMSQSVTTTPIAATQAIGSVKAIEEAAQAVEIATGYVAPTLAVDKTGLPWDERIHTSTKGKTKKDVWKRKPSLDDAFFDAIVAELREATAVPAAVLAAAPVAPSIMEQPAVASAVAAVSEALEVAPVVVPVAAPVAEPVAATPLPLVETVRDFKGLMDEIGILFKEGKAQPDYPQSIVVRINTGFTEHPDIATLTDVAANVAMVDYAWQCIDVDTAAGII